jgi:hypothetical protein
MANDKMAAQMSSKDSFIAAIQFERTMDGLAQGKPVSTLLWRERGVVRFLKVDKGLEAEKDGLRRWPAPSTKSTAPRSSRSDAGLQGEARSSAGRLGVFSQICVGLTCSGAFIRRR